MKNRIVDFTDALQVASFCKHWWRKLTKGLDSYHLSKERKIMVICKIAKGLITESLLLAANKDDRNHIKLCMDDMFNEWRESFDE